MKRKITREDFGKSSFSMRVTDFENEHKASFTHYLQNHRNGVSQCYKKDALTYAKELLAQKHPVESITNEVAEEALHSFLLDFKNVVPFPKPKKQEFTFIDLFAGIGGFRIAFQNIGGKCVFTSEWDKYSQKTYEANFG